MRTIVKGPEPRSLAHYRAGGQGSYAGYPNMDELRESLLREQRSLCCYCMNRIVPSAMIVEHWRSRSRYPELQLTYSNLLGSCLGGKGQRAANQHCDNRKGSKDLKFNPARTGQQIEKLIIYGFDGTISSADEEFSVQLNEILGLNNLTLKNQRKAQLAAVLEWQDRKKQRLKNSPSREQLRRQRDRLLDPNQDDLQPFAPVAAWWLEQKISRLERSSRA